MHNYIHSQFDLKKAFNINDISEKNQVGGFISFY